MQHKKLVVISDLHIGGDEIIEDFECEKELISFLDHLENQNEEIELVILGDFFDLWKIEENEDDQVAHAINQRPKLFDRFKAFGEKYKITVLAGNHDHALAYNKKYQEDLEKYNIHVDTNQFFKREYHHNGKVFRILGEHGNQVEPSTAFPEFGMPTDSSLSYHIAKLFVYKVMRLGTDEKRPDWVKNLDNVDTDMIPYWFLSKYFYYEVGPVLRAIFTPMLVLFGFALPFFIFDVVTDFYRPQWLLPILNFLETNIIMKAVIFILYFDMVVLIILLFASLLRKDFTNKLKTYGIQSLSEMVISLREQYENRAKEVKKGINPFNVKADFYVVGHTHMPGLFIDKNGEYSYADTGSWKQLMKRVNARFRFPSIFVPYYALNYLIVERDGDEMHIQLREWPKKFKPTLTLLERLAMKKGKAIPKPIEKDTLTKEIRIPLA